MALKRRLAVLGLLLTAVACSRDRVEPSEYLVQTNCSGGGGMYTCSAKNSSPTKLGPFDLEFEFVDDRGVSIGKSTVTNTQGLEPEEGWEFSLAGPSTARAVKLTRVTPR